tara:strand:- start:403 stop:795 length:393 start_codon:yes stop_codon:yes gene_type:complete
MPVLYTEAYNLKLVELNPAIRHVYVESHEKKGGEPALVKVRNLEGSLPITLRNNYADSGYLVSDTESRDVVLVEEQFQVINRYLRMGVTVCLPTVPLTDELSLLKKHSPKVEQYLLKRLSLLKQMFPLQE